MDKESPAELGFPSDFHARDVLPAVPIAPVEA